MKERLNRNAKTASRTLYENVESRITGSILRVMNPISAAGSIGIGIASGDPKWLAWGGFLAGFSSLTETRLLIRRHRTHKKWGNIPEQFRKEE